MRVGYVCTNFNTAAYTATALRSFYEGVPRDAAIAVVVDNGSRPDDVARLRELQREFPQATILYRTDNVGYFAGLNIGLAQIRRAHPEVEHVVVGNNDLTFFSGFHEALASCEDVLSRWAVLAPDLLTPTGQHQNPHVLAPISRARRFVWALYFAAYPLAVVIRAFAQASHPITGRPERVGNADWHSQSGPILMGYGACFVLGPRFFARFDRLFAPTFLMQEEFFLAEQLRSVGQQVYYEPRLRVQHRDHASVGQLPNRRLWQLSRDAYQVYRDYLALPRERQLAWIAEATVA